MQISSSVSLEVCADTVWWMPTGRQERMFTTRLCPSTTSTSTLTNSPLLALPNDTLKFASIFGEAGISSLMQPWMIMCFTLCVFVSDRAGESDRNGERVYCCCKVSVIVLFPSTGMQPSQLSHSRSVPLRRGLINCNIGKKAAGTFMSLSALM